MLLIWGIEVGALAVGVVLAFYVGRASEKPLRTTSLSIALLVVAFVGLVTYTLARINYVIPVGWFVAIGAAAVVALGLVVLIGRGIKWRASKLLGVAGVVLMAWVMYGNLTSWGVGRELTLPLWMDRAEQIGRANGFTPLVTAEYDMSAGYDRYSIDPLPGTQSGLEIEYMGQDRGGMGFRLQERKAEGASLADLEKLVAVGASPMGEDGGKIAPGGVVTTTTVQGQPAVGVWYPFQSPGADKEGKSTDGVNTKVFAQAVLIFELNGVDVRMWNEAGESNPGPEWTPQVLVDALLQAAGTLEPLR